MIHLYKYLGIFLIPFIKINILLRIKRGKEVENRYRERFGIPSQKKPLNSLIWIHAASVGEFKSADLLINALYKDYTILVTTTTVSAANYAKKFYADKIIHQFAPLDISFWVKKFLYFWKPNLVIWIESDLWPITMHFIKNMKIKALLVNVRISPQSFTKWKKIQFFYKQITDCFAEIFAQSAIDKDRIINLTKRDVKFIGNLKLANVKRNSIINHREPTDYQKVITLMISSTHKGEEIQLLPMIKRILNQYKKMQIIIAPRHPDRSSDILYLCNKYKISAKLDNDKKNEQKNVLIVNSFGNLPQYFQESDIVFLGGSLVAKGGHNPIEPAAYNCVILTGNHIYNWQNIYEDMITNNACIKIHSIVTLENKIKNLINNNKLIEKMKNNANMYSKKRFFDDKKLFDSISNQLRNLDVKSS